MKRILTACLSLGAALTLAATAEAQDTSQAGAAPMPQDSAPTTQMQGDTLGGDSARSGYPSDTSAQSRSSGYQGMQADSLADSTRIRPDSDTTAAGTGTSAAPSGKNGSTGVAPDTTLPGDQSPRQPEGPEERIHSDSGSADSSSSN
jgi:hypothetical protein